MGHVLLMGQTTSRHHIPSCFIAYFNIMENVLIRVTPSNLKGFKKASMIKTIKAYKDQYVCRKSVGYACSKTSPCKDCKTLMAIMCKRYHHHDAADELAMRLVYEGMFGFIPLDAIENGTWLNSKYRDSGHTMRMRIIWQRATPNVQKSYPWIVTPKYYASSHV